MEVTKKCLDFFRVPYFVTVSQIDWEDALSSGEELLGTGTWWHSLVDDVEQGVEDKPWFWKEFDLLRTLEEGEEEEEDERESSNS